MKKSDIAKMIKDIENERDKLKLSSNADPEWRNIIRSLQVLIHWYD